MARKARIVATAGIVSMAFSVLTFVPHTTLASEPPQLTAADMAYIHDRVILGFQADADYIKQMDQTYSVDVNYGFPMTPDEHSDMLRRSALKPIISHLDSALNDLSTYSGTWIDQAAGGILTVAFVGLPTVQAKEILSAVIPAEVKYKLTTVVNSKHTLEFVQVEATKDMLAHAQADGAYNSSQLLLADNKVQISVATDTSPEEEASILAKYGPQAVSVIREAAYQPATVGNWDYTTGRLFGGQWINAYPSATGERCSVTYADAKSAYNETYAVTAGHCGQVGHRWYQGYAATSGSASLGRTIGTMHTNSYFVANRTSDCDCSAIGPLPTGFGTNRVMISGNAPNTPTTRALSSTLLSAPVGEYMCALGAATWQDTGALTCGHVSSQSATNGYGSFTLTDALQLSDMLVRGGDSGGPIIDDNSLVAIVACGNTAGAGTCASKAGNLSTAGLSLSYTT